MSNIVSVPTDYIKWLFGQLKGWKSRSYALVAFALGCQLMTLIGAAITPLSIITFIGSILGVLCVVAITEVKPVNGLLGIISGICFIVAGYAAKNYLSIGEQLAYIATLDLPILINRKRWNSNTKNEIKTFGTKEWIISISFTVVIFLLSSFGIQALTNDPRPFIDGLSFAIALTAGIICFLRYNNHFIWWVASGLIQVILWGATAFDGGASFAMLINYAIYLANDYNGIFKSDWFDIKGTFSKLKNKFVR